LRRGWRVEGDGIAREGEEGSVKKCGTGKGYEL